MVVSSNLTLATRALPAEIADPGTHLHRNCSALQVRVYPRGRWNAEIRITSP